MVGEKAFWLKDYTVYHSRSELEAGSHGGSALLIQNDIAHIPLVLDTPLQAVAVQMKLSRVYIICSLYLSPNTEQSESQLTTHKSAPTAFFNFGWFEW